MVYGASRVGDGSSTMTDIIRSRWGTRTGTNTVTTPISKPSHSNEAGFDGYVPEAPAVAAAPAANPNLDDYKKATVQSRLSEIFWVPDIATVTSSINSSIGNVFKFMKNKSGRVITPLTEKEVENLYYYGILLEQAIMMNRSETEVIKASNNFLKAFSSTEQYKTFYREIDKIHQQVLEKEKRGEPLNPGEKYQSDPLFNAQFYCNWFFDQWLNKKGKRELANIVEDWQIKNYSNALCRYFPLVRDFFGNSYTMRQIYKEKIKNIINAAKAGKEDPEKAYAKLEKIAKELNDKRIQFKVIDGRKYEVCPEERSVQDIVRSFGIKNFTIEGVKQ